MMKHFLLTPASDAQNQIIHPTENILQNPSIYTFPPIRNNPSKTTTLHYSNFSKNITISNIFAFFKKCTS